MALPSEPCLHLALQPCLHLALQWQGDNDAVMFASFRLGQDRPSAFLAAMRDYCPRLLVVLKAWEGPRGQWQEQGPHLLKTTFYGAWAERTMAMEQWLRDRPQVSSAFKKEHGLTMPGILWRPLSPTKAEQRQALDLPPWATTARDAALFIVGASPEPLTTAEAAECCQGVYAEKTMRNALNGLRQGGLASSYGSSGQPRAWLLTKTGQAEFDRLQQLFSFYQ